MSFKAFSDDALYTLLLQSTQSESKTQTTSSFHRTLTTDTELMASNISRLKL